MGPARVIECHRGREWLEKVMTHGVGERHDTFGWADNPTTRHYGLQCMSCDFRWVILLEKIKFGHEDYDRVLADALRTQAGKQNTLNALQDEIRLRIQGAREPATAWARILADGPDLV